MDEAYKLLTSDEMAVLKEHYKAKEAGQLSDRYGWTAKRKQMVAKLYERIRDNGFAVAGLYPSGSIRFSARKKSATELIMELGDDDFRLYLSGKLRFVGGRFEKTEAACR